MQLSKEAIQDLRLILEAEIGTEKASQLSEDDVNHLGDFLLTLRAEAIKRRMELFVPQQS